MALFEEREFPLPFVEVEAVTEAASKAVADSFVEKVKKSRGLFGVIKVVSTRVIEEHESKEEEFSDFKIVR